ncbi:peptide-methionine (S)-S-oxide reductase MsrA [Pleomorphomonas sp. JP5]|uniref:peptide-methionine (S)-S-oxide reductase MsrA n=1 Tax=Pleomorphomonas sp. JP5 TaxID=2942998 RepID=UPI0020448767|nr:peptide-methionine (S)-S-oxide reductase MsrA [Pleomorphomonas sp. JP5]MCM5559681.1 peptide-methionine (S)-S-oxide reductase MsrA [Pleomorphomonas sp. JP5]
MPFFESLRKPATLPTPDTALPGRDRPIATAETHFVNGRPLKGPVPEGHAVAIFALGCFWGAERLFWRSPGVYRTSVGYIGGFTENPTYEEVCSGRTGHAEAVEVVFDPSTISYADLVRLFFESHDPTQGMRQGNDVGTQYRSVIFVHDEAQRAVAELVRDAYAKALDQAGRTAAITTTIEPAGPYYFAEDYHQQYLAKNPGGYCGLGGTGVSCPTPGVGVRP